MTEKECLENIIGETIAGAKIIGHSEHCDGENVLVLEMKSGKKFYAIGGYGGFTGKSCGEYPEYVSLTDEFV